MNKDLENRVKAARDALRGRGVDAELMARLGLVGIVVARTVEEAGELLAEPAVFMLDQDAGLYVLGELAALGGAEG
jgi:hypothetical protein